MKRVVLLLIYSVMCSARPPGIWFPPKPYSIIEHARLRHMQHYYFSRLGELRPWFEKQGIKVPSIYRLCERTNRIYSYEELVELEEFVESCRHISCS